MSRLMDMYEALCKGQEFEGVDDFDYNKNAKPKIIEIIVEDFGFNEKQAEIIFNQAWIDGHSTGVNTVAYKADDMALLMQEVMRAGQEA